MISVFAVGALRDRGDKLSVQCRCNAHGASPVGASFIKQTLFQRWSLHGQTCESSVGDLCKVAGSSSLPLNELFTDTSNARSLRSQYRAKQADKQIIFVFGIF